GKSFRNILRPQLRSRFQERIPISLLRPLGREDDFACVRVAADVHFGTLEAKFGGKAHGLTSAVLEQLGRLGFGKVRLDDHGAYLQGYIPEYIYRPARRLNDHATAPRGTTWNPVQAAAGRGRGSRRTTACGRRP